MQDNILSQEFNNVAGRNPERYAVLVAPGNQLPELKAAASQFLFVPSRLSQEFRIKAAEQAAAMASRFFDTDLMGEALLAKSGKRCNLFVKSAAADDGTLLFFMNEGHLYGYARVMVVSNKEWKIDYLEKKAIPESAFESCSADLLKTEEGAIYMQALVFPEFPHAAPHDKRVLQEFALMSLLGGFLSREALDKGVDVNFTAFNPYTDKLAIRMGAREIAKNAQKHPIYNLRISSDQPENTFGRLVYERLSPSNNL